MLCFNVYTALLSYLATILLVKDVAKRLVMKVDDECVLFAVRG